MKPSAIISDLREAPFYRGQILRCREYDGRLPEVMDIADFFEREPRLRDGSLGHILRTLGYDAMYASLGAGLARAFPSNHSSGDDGVLVAPWSDAREHFWQLVCLAEALDEGNLCLVVCSNDERVEIAHRRLAETVQKAEINYAINVARLLNASDYSTFENQVPMVLVLKPTTLVEVLAKQGHKPLRDCILSSVGRVVIPSLDEWPPALASNASYAFRRLHLECALRGVFPTLAGTACEAMEIEAFSRVIWGRHLKPETFIRRDSVESVPMHVVNYTAPIIRDPSDPKRWLRQDIATVAEELLIHLAGKPSGTGLGRKELHYVLDISGSMVDRLPNVKEAVVRDLGMRLEKRFLKEGDWVKLTVFDDSAVEVFAQEFGPDLANSFAGVIGKQEIQGGTNIPVALGAALSSTLKGDCEEISIVLFSDGGSCVLPSHKAHLLNLVRMARAQGRRINLHYILLDMDPSQEITNLIEEMGGRIDKCSADSLAGVQLITTERLRKETVVFLSGEAGLSGEVAQKCQGGLRPVLFTRDRTKAFTNPRDVVAVVASGRFGSLEEVLQQVRHLGRESLAVFVLTEAEAWAQTLTEDFAEAQKLVRAPLIHPANPLVANMRLTEFVADQDVDAEFFRYMQEGDPAYEDLLSYLGVKRTEDTRPGRQRESGYALPAGFDYVEHGAKRFVRLREGPTKDLPFTTFSADQVTISGAGIKQHRDAATAALVLHRGSLVETSDASGEVGKKAPDGSFLLGPKTGDRYVLMLNQPLARPLDLNAWKEHSRNLGEIGEFSQGAVEFSVKAFGLRWYEKANLDGVCREEHFPVEEAISFRTAGFCWKPKEANAQLTTALANLLRLTACSLFKYADQTTLVYSDSDGAVWLIELAPGGNGASTLLAGNLDIFTNLIALGGRIVLNCPCEGGLAGATTQVPSSNEDTGCPRCTRAFGPVILLHGQPAADPQKRELLEWLLKRRLLPGTAALHIKEKYEGIRDTSRYCGGDNGSRHSLFRLARRILRDRLGTQIEDEDVAAFDWLADDAAKQMLGCYSSGDNTIHMLAGLLEWQALDVTAHELFHNFQWKANGLFDHAKLCQATTPPIPFDGKLFLEGSAMWAESHVVDALAIRTSLDLANLRQGDEYGEGFQLLKFIEENYGGVSAVLQFLSTGDILATTAGKITTLSRLYAAAGIDHMLR